MKKYLAVASLFLANNEIISLLALVILTVMFIAFLAKSAQKEGMR